MLEDKYLYSERYIISQLFLVSHINTGKYLLPTIISEELKQFKIKNGTDNYNNNFNYVLTKSRYNKIIDKGRRLLFSRSFKESLRS